MARFSTDRARKPYIRAGASTVDRWQHDRAPPEAPAAASNGNRLPASINTKLVVSNLHYEITPKDLTSIFGQIGTLIREPHIRYDRSGRSSGVAIITFETPAEATRAKNQFNGILAKGQPMSIAYDTVQVSRRAVSAPSSLLNRIQRPPLLKRFGRDDDDSVRPPSGPRAGVGPVRSRTARGRVPVAGPRNVKTVEDLDKELDAFMLDGKDESVPPSASAASAQPEGDVEMT